MRAYNAFRWAGNVGRDRQLCKAHQLRNDSMGRSNYALHVRALRNDAKTRKWSTVSRAVANDQDRQQRFKSAYIDYVPFHNQKRIA